MRITSTLKITKPALAVILLITLALLARCTAVHNSTGNMIASAASTSAP